MTLSRDTLQLARTTIAAQSIQAGHPDARATAATVFRALDELEAALADLDRAEAIGR